jgi:hypothetical protein
MKIETIENANNTCDSVLDFCKKNDASFFYLIVNKEQDYLYSNMIGSSHAFIAGLNMLLKTYPTVKKLIYEALETHENNL